MEQIVPYQREKLVRRRRRLNWGRLLQRTIVATLILLGLIIAALPFVWMAVSSLGGANMVISIGWTWSIFDPRNWTIEPYITAWKVAGLNRYILNTVIYAVLVTGFATLTSTLAGYAFGRLRFPGRNILFGLVIASMMIPGSVTMIPLFALMLHIPLTGGNNMLGMGGHGLYDSMAGLVLPQVVSVGSIFLCRQFFQTLPSDLEDAARIDGCGEFGIWWRVILPLSGPVLTVVALFQFQGSWNTFIWPLIMSSSEKLYTVQVGLYSLVHGSGSMAAQAELYQSALLAGSVMSVLPILALFIAFQRRFVQGISLTGLK